MSATYKTVGVVATLLGLANAQNIPTKVTILTPREGSSVGVNGRGWMIDVVAEFSTPSTASSASAAVSPATTTPASGSIGYRRSRRAANTDDGFFPLLNSPNLTSFAPGPDIAAPGFVCLVNTSSDPTQNFAGVFQLNAITNSDDQGNILEAYFSWFVVSAAFGSNVNSTTTVFFLNETAPAKYTGNPLNDPNVISNVATADFFIFGNAASNTTAATSMATPLSIDVFTPRAGEDVGVDGAGWMIDMVVVNSDLNANYFAPSKGYEPLYHDNFTDPKFAPGIVSEAVPGLVVLSNTSTLAGGANTNLANLFQINAVTGVQNGVIAEYWCTWLVGAAFAGKNQPSGLTIFVVNGTAPTSINGTLPSNIISDVVTVNFTLSGNATSSSSAPASSTSASDDGRVDVNLDYDLFNHLSRLVPDFHASPEYYEDENEPPPEYSESIPAAWIVHLNIVIQVVGSRGDVQPFVALGTELQRCGHRVRVATHNIFRDFVCNTKLEFFSIGGDPAELMAYMVKNPGLIPSMESLRAGEVQKNRRMVEEMLNGSWRSCIEPDPVTGTSFVADAIVANPPSFAHVHCAEALSIPLHLMFTMPWSPTRLFPHPLANIKSKSSSVDPAGANYLSLGDIVNEWRKTIDLEPVPNSEGPNLATILKVPFTYCWSPALVPKPLDWESNIDVCGFFFRDSPQYTPELVLEEFLRRGTAPVYIGFGNIVVDDPDSSTAIVLEAVQSTGVRAVISKGWSNLGTNSASTSTSPSILYIDECPHEWLFQHVAAVVHHGGAGTTACGLRYGRPTVVVPFFGDQPFWGSMVVKAGAGPEAIPYKSLNKENLAAAIEFCLTSEASKAAEQISKKMIHEYGVTQAVKSFHANLPLENLQCDILPDQPAVWEYGRKIFKLKLSKIAAEILIDQLKLESKTLKVHRVNPIVIEHRRWDPITGTSSAAIKMGVDVSRSAIDIFTKPVKAYHQAARDGGPSRPSHERANSIASGSTQTSSNQMQANDTEHANKKGKSPMAPLGAAAVASVSGIGNIVGSSVKMLVVDVPLAATEGFRAVPKLYGGQVQGHKQVEDWKSGLEVAGKNFVSGMADGLTDFFMEPVRGGKENGAMGAVKGFGKGIVNITTKMPSAAIGIVAYPSQGIYRSIRTSIKSSTRDAVIKARHAEGQYLGWHMGDRESKVAFVLEAFNSKLKVLSR
ncbi:hypothetical protein B7463_g11490, partial [Scytalidium lignicola]